MTVPIEIRHPHHGPARRKSRAIGACNMNIVVHLPNDRLARARTVEEVIWMTVVVKVIRYRRGWRVC